MASAYRELPKSFDTNVAFDISVVPIPKYKLPQLDIDKNTSAAELFRQIKAIREVIPSGKERARFTVDALLYASTVMKPNELITATSMVAAAATLATSKHEFAEKLLSELLLYVNDGKIFLRVSGNKTSEFTVDMLARGEFQAKGNSFVLNYGGKEYSFVEPTQASAMQKAKVFLDALPGQEKTSYLKPADFRDFVQKNVKGIGDDLGVPRSDDLAGKLFDDAGHFVQRTSAVSTDSMAAMQKVSGYYATMKDPQATKAEKTAAGNDLNTFLREHRQFKGELNELAKSTGDPELAKQFAKALEASDAAKTLLYLDTVLKNLINKKTAKNWIIGGGLVVAGAVACYLVWGGGKAEHKYPKPDTSTYIHPPTTENFTQ